MATPSTFKEDILTQSGPFGPSMLLTKSYKCYASLIQDRQGPETLLRVESRLVALFEGSGVAEGSMSPPTAHELYFR